MIDGPFAPRARSDSVPSPNPQSSPRRKGKERVYDRFIPNRDVDLQASYHMRAEYPRPSQGPSTPTRSTPKRVIERELGASQSEEANRTFNALLKTELFGPALDTNSSPRSASDYLTASPSTSRYASANSAPSIATLTAPASPSRNLFSYSRPASAGSSHVGIDSPVHERYSTSPVKYESQRLLLSPRKPTRSVSKVPFKVLDAPELADDFYLNLVDWSSHNYLAVGLGSCAYLWSAHTSKVTKLCDLAPSNDSVTSVAWVNRGTQLAVGSNVGKVFVYDTEHLKLIRTMDGHSARVGCLAWNNHILSSGSRDRNIYHRDVRAREHFIRKLGGHKQEVCGLKWNTSENQLASGGNDNKLFVWDYTNNTPLHRFSEHTAAVKAIGWNPHQHGILASGGGTADKKIRFWNTLTGSALTEVDTGSQVCNLMWSKTSNELVTTHGFSTGPVQHQVVVWKYPTMQQVAMLTGHTLRVLYLAMSPDGQTIVTGAGDETLRFWSAFVKSKGERKSEMGKLNPFGGIR